MCVFVCLYVRVCVEVKRGRLGGEERRAREIERLCVCALAHVCVFVFAGVPSDYPWDPWIG